MSFSDWQTEIEETFIQPLQNFRQKVTAFNQVHNDCMNRIGDIMGGLLTGSDGQPAFQGQGADNLANTIGQFLDTEQQYAGSSDYLIGRLADASDIYEKAARNMQQRLNEIASESGQSGAVEAVGAVAMGLDIGAAAQGGVDVPWDLVAAGASLLAMGLAATSNPDQVRTRDAVTALVTGTDEVNSEIESGPSQENLPETQPDPGGPKGDYKAFLKTLGIIVGIGAGAAGVYLLFSNWPVDPDTPISTFSPDEIANS